MASEKKAIIIFSDIEGKAVAASKHPSLEKIYSKGAACLKASNSTGDRKTLALTGSMSGQTLMEAATADGLVVDGIDGEFDLAVLDAPADEAGLEALLAKALDIATRQTTIVLVAKDALFFQGYGIARSTVLDKEYCPCSVATTIAYIADFPVPAQAESTIIYPALKENLKRKEVIKLQESVQHMEAAIERKSRQPWDKHDCA